MAKTKDTNNQKTSSYTFVDSSKGNSSKKLSKKVIALICIISLLVFAGGGTLTYFLVFAKDSSPTVTRLWIEEFNQETDTYFLMRWDSVRNASDYEVEYSYSINDSESGGKKIESYVTTTNGLRLVRKKGTFSYRVKPNLSNGKGEFTEWQTFEIAPIALANPEISVSLVGGDLIVTISPVYYEAVSGRRCVYSYEIIETVVYADNGEKYSLNSHIKSIKEEGDFVYKYEGYQALFDSDVTFTLKVRSMNKKYYDFFGENGGITQMEDESERQYLFDIYDVSENYTEKSVTIQANQ